MVKIHIASASSSTARASRCLDAASMLIAVFAIDARPAAPTGSLVDMPTVAGQQVDDTSVRVMYTLSSRADVVGGGMVAEVAGNRRRATSSGAAQ